MSILPIPNNVFCSGGFDRPHITVTYSADAQGCPVCEALRTLAVRERTIGEVELALGGTPVDPAWGPLAQAVVGLRGFAYDASVIGADGSPGDFRARATVEAALNASPYGKVRY